MSRRSTQRDYMRALVQRFGPDRERVVREYAAAELRGDVERSSDVEGMSADSYARSLYGDGERKRWLGR
jgi:hypothetical protein